MKKLILSIVVFIGIVRFSYGQTKPIFSQAERYKTRKFDSVIFPFDSADMIGSSQRFTPTKEEVDRAEFALRHNLKRLNSPRLNQSDFRIIYKKLKKYRRQYFGYIDEKGNRILLLNCLWNSKKQQDVGEWLEKYISVLGGGSYYWNVKFNLESNTLFDLVVNGNS